MKIVMNDALAQSWDLAPFSAGVSGNTGLTASFSFWDGAMPDLNAVFNPDTITTLSTLLTALGLDQSRFIGAINPSNLQAGTTNWIDTNVPGLVNIRNTRSVRNMVAQKSSSPTICLMIYIPDWNATMTNFAGGSNAAITWAQFMAQNLNLGVVTSGGATIGLFTAGDEQSDAEVRLLGGSVVSGNSYRLSDLTLNIAPAYFK